MSLDKCIQLRIHSHSQDTERFNYPKHYILFRISVGMFGYQLISLLQIEPKHFVINNTDTFHA